MKNKSIGILGGMGPQASNKMVEVILDMAIKEFGAKSGEDFPEIILFSVPVPSAFLDGENIKKALPLLRQRVSFLNNMNVSVVVMACNTAHLLLKDLQAQSKVPFVSIIEVVCDQVAKESIKKVGILAGALTTQSHIYQECLKTKKIKSVVPSDKQLLLLEEVIQKIVAGSATFTEIKILVNLALCLKKQGAEGIILGCTELPLIFPENFPLPIFDSIKISSRGLLTKFFDLKGKN